MNRKLKIHVWLPDIFQFKGGIQVYSAFLVQALEQVLPNSDRHVFLKNDAVSNNELEFHPETKFEFSGKYKSSIFHTSVFSWQVLSAALIEKPDLIICGHINFSPLALYIFQLLKIPYWVIIHGVDSWNLRDKDKIKGLKYAEKIISVSQYTKDRLIREQSILPDLISLLPNTFDTSQFTIKAKPKYLLDRYQLDTEKQIILTVSRLVQSEQYKGYDRVLKALPKIREAIPNVHYLIVGKGDDRPRIENLIQQLHLEDYVTLTGFIPDEELCDHYNLCDVFAMPSKGEGFGIVYLEAMACGKPCLGGNQDGALDALAQGKLGVIIDPDNINKIAEALVQILQKKYPNPILYEPNKLRQAVIDHFGFEKFRLTLDKYLKEFLDY